VKVDLREVQSLTGELKYQAYGALDATGTREIYDAILPRLNPDQRRIYAWSKAQTSPAFAMTRRGILVDEVAREAAKKQLKIDMVAAAKVVAAHPLVERWDGTDLETGWCPKGIRYATVKGKCTDGKAHKWPTDWKVDPAAPHVRCAKCDVPRLVAMPEPIRHRWSEAELEGDRNCLTCGAARMKPLAFSATSHSQVDHLLYDLLDVPVQGNRTSDRTTDDAALERIAREGHAFIKTSTGRKFRKKLDGLTALCEEIRNVRDMQKQLGFLKARLSADGRFYATFNVFAPWTGRWSSSKDPFQRGSNLQNVTERHRRIFIADPGHELFYADLKTAESLVVAYLSGDAAYIEAHNQDVHTYVCRLVWPNLAWTGDIKTDKTLANTWRPPWDDVPGHEYRFQAKRVAHGANYGRSAFSVAIENHIPVAAAQEALTAYFKAFPGIRAWQRWINLRVDESEPIHGLMGRVVSLFGRPRDPHTYKQGLALAPQGGVGDILNLGLWRVWRHLDPHLVQLLAQVHDAILGQWRIGDRAEAISRITECMRVAVPVVDFQGVERMCVIPVEIAAGLNWSKRNTNPAKGLLNPEGLEEVA